MGKLSHLDDRGSAHMVDVGAKDITSRVAVASASVTMKPETLELIRQGLAKKGDVLAVAKIAGIQAAKKTAELIPLCHQLNLSSIELELKPDEDKSRVDISAKCMVDAKTGVEMEALTAVSVAALTIYDMCKAVDRGMMVNEIKLNEKHGGKTGSWTRK